MVRVSNLAGIVSGTMCCVIPTDAKVILKYLIRLITLILLVTGTTKCLFVPHLWDKETFSSPC